VSFLPAIPYEVQLLVFTVIHSIQAVAQVFDSMKRNRATRGGDLTSELREVLDQCSSVAGDIFDPMVERAHIAEKVISFLSFLSAHHVTRNATRSTLSRATSFCSTCPKRLSVTI
jgi:uncharacterized protein YacL